VTNVKDAHPIFEHSIEDFLGIPDKRNDMHPRPLDNSGSGVRPRGYMCDDLTNAEFNRGSYRVAKRATIG
jgi:hypothetical protein